MRWHALFTAEGWLNLPPEAMRKLEQNWSFLSKTICTFVL